MKKFIITLIAGFVFTVNSLCMEPMDTIPDGTEEQEIINSSTKNPDLYNAINSNNVNLAIQLIYNKIGIEYIDENENTTLHIACLNGLTEVASELISINLTNLKGIDLTNNKQETPLHLSSANGHIEITKLLIDNGANVNAKTNYDEDHYCDYTPLHLACSNGHIEIAKLLINKGADINAKNEMIQTPLHLACAEGHREIAELLIKRDADIHAVTEYGYTPLHQACENKHIEIVKLLIDKSANINVKTENDDLEVNGKTPLHIACEQGHLEIAKLLIEKGANVYAIDSENETPISIAVEKDRAEIIDTLIRLGVKHKETKFKIIPVNSINSLKKLTDLGFDISQLPIEENNTYRYLISDLFDNFISIEPFGIINFKNEEINLNTIEINKLESTINSYIKHLNDLTIHTIWLISKTERIIPIEKVINLTQKLDGLIDHLSQAKNMLRTYPSREKDILRNIELSEEPNEKEKFALELKSLYESKNRLEKIIYTYEKERFILKNFITYYFCYSSEKTNKLYTEISNLSQELSKLQTSNNNFPKEINPIILYCIALLTEQNPEEKYNFRSLLKLVERTFTEISGKMISFHRIQFNGTYEENLKELSILINNNKYFKFLSEHHFYKIKWLVTKDLQNILKNKLKYNKFMIYGVINNISSSILNIIKTDTTIGYYDKLMTLSYLASIRFEDKTSGKFINLISNREIADCMAQTTFFYDFFHNPVCNRLRARCFEIEETNDDNTPHIKDIFGKRLINALSEYPTFIPAFFNLAEGSLLHKYKEVYNETTNKEKAPKAKECTESEIESTLETTFIDHILLNNKKLVEKLTNQLNPANNINKKINLKNTDENSIKLAARIVSPITLNNITTDEDKSYSVNEFHKRFVNTFSLYHLLQGILVKDYKLNFSNDSQNQNEKTLVKEEFLTGLPKELVTKILSFTDGTLAKTTTDPDTGNYETLSDDASYLPSENCWEPISNVKKLKKELHKRNNMQNANENTMINPPSAIPAVPTTPPVTLPTIPTYPTNTPESTKVKDGSNITMHPLFQ